MASLMLVNPRKRRKTSVKRRKNPISRRRKSTSLATVSHHKKHKRYRRNPIGGGTTSITGQLKNAGIGAAGALAVDLLMNKLPIPANLKTGTMLHLTQGVVSLGLGMAVAKFGKNKKLGQQLADGGLTIALYTAGKSLVGSHLGLSGYEDLSGDLLGFELAGDNLLGAEYYGDQGEYMAGTEDDWSMGWRDPAEVGY